MPKSILEKSAQRTSNKLRKRFRTEPLHHARARAEGILVGAAISFLMMGGDVAALESQIRRAARIRDEMQAEETTDET